MFLLYQKGGRREENSSAVLWTWHFPIQNDTTQIWAMETAPREEARAKKGGAGSWTLEPKALLSVTVNRVSLGTSLPFWKHSLLNAAGACGGTNRTSTEGRQLLQFHSIQCDTHLLSSFMYHIISPAVTGGHKSIRQSSWVWRTYNLINDRE